MNQDFVSRQQLALLPERIWKAQATNATDEVYSFLDDLQKSITHDFMKIMVVGAGGSFPAAISISHSLRDEMCTSDVEALTPQTALRILSQADSIFVARPNLKYDVVIGISYSGKTPDIKAVYVNCNKKKIPFILFTGADKESLIEDYPESQFLKIISYFNAEDTTGKERGMISMFSTLAPAILFDDITLSYISKVRDYTLYYGWLNLGKKYVSELDIPKIARAIQKNPIIHVFYEWETFGIAADIASKFMESGIACVVLHEKKNFSHGLYTLLYKQNFGMIINVTKFAIACDIPDCKIRNHATDYDDVLDVFLKEICEKKGAIYLEIGNSWSLTASNIIQELCKLPYLITAIGEELNIDISKPFSPGTFPEEPKALYGYVGEF